MINVQLIRFAELRAKIQELPEAVRQRTAMEMDRIVVYITRLVKANKLSGDPLHVRTGLLRNSIHGVVEGRGTDNVVGVVGTAVKYAHIHEYGFQGTVEVPAYVRMMGFNKRGARIAMYTKAGNLRKQVAYATEVPVRAHSMRMNMPERSFLRSTLFEELPTIREALQIAVVDAARKGLKP